MAIRQTRGGASVKEWPVCSWIESVCRGTRTLLMETAPLLWIGTAITAVLDIHRHLTVVLGLGALAGTVLGAMRERDGESGNDAARLVLEAVLATRSQQQADQGLHLVTDEARGSEPQLPRQSAG